MCTWRFVVTLGLMLDLGAGCGPVTMQQRAEEAEQSGDWAKAMAGYDYEYDKTLPRERDRLEAPRNHAATQWMRGELARAKTALATGEPEAAFGIATTLTREAKRRKLATLDADELQPVATQAVIALLPKVMAKPLADGNAAAARREARMLLAVLDAKGAAEARAVAAPLLRTHAERETQLAAAAQAEGRIASAYFHRALADDYALRVRTADEQKASREAIDQIARFWWMMKSESPCAALGDTTQKWVLGRKAFGRLATLRWEVTTCNLEPETWITQEPKAYRQIVKGGTTGGSRGEGHYVRSQTCVSDGQCGATTTTGEWVQGTYTPGGVTADSYVQVEGVARVTHTRHHWQVEAKLIAETAGEPSVEVPFSHASSVEVESWEILGAAPGDQDTRNGPDADKLGAARTAVAAAIEYRIASATELMASQRTKALADLGAAATTPDAAEDHYIAAVRAYGKAHPSAVSFLETRVGVPGDDVAALILTGGTPDGASPLAFQLAVPQPAEDAAAQRGTQQRVMTTLARRHDGDKHVELMAGLTQGAASTDRMGAGSGDSALGIGAGLVYGVIVDPGIHSGTIFEAAMDFRLGYAGAMFYDTSVPVALGRRFGNVGVTLLGSVGWDKFGDKDAASLYLNTAPYYGYGLGASLLTAGKLDFAASYLHVGRSSRLAETDEPTIAEEDRFELRVLKYQSVFELVTLTARYTQAAGEMQEGRILTVWVGFAAR